MRFSSINHLRQKAENPIDIRNMDLSVSPRQSFYRYANGGWLDRNKIPDDQSSWNAWDELSQKVSLD
jgi:putative endopeptidase